MKKIYSKVEAQAVVQGILDEIKKKKSDLDRPDAFIDEHPWTLKYLSGGFSESNDLLRRVHSNPESAKVVEVEIPATIRTYRSEHRMRPQIKFEIVVDGIEKNGRSFIFNFDEKSDDVYICTNG